MLPHSRRKFLSTCGLLASSWGLSEIQGAVKETYETDAKGIRIVPGQWRPHYPFEHIAWISPPWPSQDYLWFDFPEAIFAGKSLLYLSHVNPAFPQKHRNLPAVPWRQTAGGLTFERKLPDGVQFQGTLVTEDPHSVQLSLCVINGSSEPLRDLTLQTCLYLRASREFGAFTNDNKFIHHPQHGWVSLTAAQKMPATTAPYRAGWRMTGKPFADLPMILASTQDEQRHLALTWFQETLSLVGNPRHPCVHADPRVQDLDPGQSRTITGRLRFFEGKRESFDVTEFLRPRRS